MRKFSVLLCILLFSAVYGFSQSDNYNLKKVEWVFSQPDFDIYPGEEAIKTGSHKLEISRLSANETEALLIRKAESLYPKETPDVNTKKPSVNNSVTRKIFSPSVEESPFWSNSAFDGVKIAKIISARAIDYYQKLSAAYRNDEKPTTINMTRTNFSYAANVVHYDKYDFRRETFENVSVVFMKMKWSQYCGGECAMSFGREKFVVFDKNNEPVALFIDMDTGAVVS